MRLAPQPSRRALPCGAASKAFAALPPEGETEDAVQRRWLKAQPGASPVAPERSEGSEPGISPSTTCWSWFWLLGNVGGRGRGIMGSAVRTFYLSVETEWGSSLSLQGSSCLQGGRRCHLKRPRGSQTHGGEKLPRSRGSPLSPDPSKHGGRGGRSRPRISHLISHTCNDTPHAAAPSDSNSVAQFKLLAIKPLRRISGN